MAYILLFGLVASSSPAAFTSLYVFGDGVSTTTNGPGGSSFYGKRYSNGRVWVEVLAERQSITYESNKNWSYFGHSSTNLLVNLTNFPAPPDANTALFVVWVNNADFVFDANNFGTNLTAWTNAMNQSQSNHFKAITNLYAKGARSLIMPNAVDITKVPYYVNSSTANKNFIRQRIIDFNTSYAATLNLARASLPGIVIYSPDLFSLLDNVVTNAAHYGLTNALYNGQSVDALSDPALGDYSLNGPGTNHIFWDYLDPTAKLHAVLADVVQHVISPAQISKITSLGVSNRLDVTSLPVGLNGFVEGSTNFSNWITATNFSSTNVVQSIFVPVADPLQYYRLRFPFAWSWP